MKKVAVVGYASNWKEAPFNDSEWEIWVQNIAEVVKPGFPRFDRVFDLHLWSVIESEWHNEPAGMDFIIRNGLPVYLQEKNAIIPRSITFPLDELSAHFFPWSEKIGKNRYDDVYWTSSTQMMLALAIKEGAEEIGIYGIDMADSVEYKDQRRGCEFMLGFAIGHGIKVVRTKSTPVLRRKFIYGYETVDEKAYREYVKSRQEWLNSRIAEINQKGMQAAAEKAHLEGALHVFNDLISNWVDV